MIFGKLKRNPRTLDTPIWCGILQGLQDFRDSTTVLVGIGRSTSFWLDLLLGERTLAEPFFRPFSPITAEKMPLSLGFQALMLLDSASKTDSPLQLNPTSPPS